MPLPAGVTSFTLNFGPYTDASGAPVYVDMQGVIMPSARVTHQPTGQVIERQPVTVTIAADGTASAVLMHNDNSGLATDDGQPFTYTCTWQTPSRLTPAKKTFYVPAVSGVQVDYDALNVVQGGQAPGVSLPALLSVAGLTGTPSAQQVVDALAVPLGAEYDAHGAAATAQAASLQKSANLSDLASPATARGNLGLGSAATQPSTAFDASGAASAAQAAAVAAAATDATTKANAAQAAAVAAIPSMSTIAADPALRAAFDASGAASAAQTAAQNYAAGVALVFNLIGL